MSDLLIAATFEIAYREAVARNLDVLQLIGADISLPNRRHKLSIAYITLSVAQKTSLIMLPPDQISKQEPLEDIEKVTVSADTALSSSRRLLIKGPAGSGKTTLLQWIAVRAATKSFEGPLKDWNGTVPFYIRLRHYAQSRLPGPEAFPEFAAPAIIGTMPEKWVHTLLHAGKAIILVDGIDELSSAQREEAHTWLRDLTATYPDCRFIVTSRPHAIEDGWMNHEAFSEATLQEMALPDIESFIDHWHSAVKQELLTEEEKQELTPLADHLKMYIKQIRAIRNLATSPLLCAMLCALNRDRRRQLPVNRIELYRACCSLLLERREKESRIDLSDYPPLNYDQKIRLLSDLAYWMSKENSTEAAVSQVDTSFKKRLANMPAISSDTTGQAVRRFLVERSGMIREPVLGQVDFAHRTFQEFFTAQAALDTMDIAYLIANAQYDQWREVVILAAGLAPQIQCEQLIKGLIERGDQEKDNRYQLHLLAVSCLETAIELNTELRKELEKRLSHLVPPKNMTDAKALASAGELVIKYLNKKELEKKKKLSATVCVACIRTLSLIGGETALAILEGYIPDTRETVINELIKDWELFDNKKIYAQRILSHALKNRSSLRFERISSLEGLTDLPALTTLDLLDHTQLTDVTLSNLPALTTLDLRNCTQLTDVTLTNLPALTTLDLSGCTQLTDVSSLSNLPALTTLKLMNCTQLTDVSSLTDLPVLASLDLDGCTQLIDINPLANLLTLTTLDLRNCTQLTDVSFLSNLPALTTLYLLGCTQLTDVSPLSNLPALTTLNLSACTQLTDVSFLSNLPALITLYLRNCTQLTDVSFLTNLPALTTLDLSGCTQLTDVSPLTNLPALTAFYLSSCTQLTDVTLTNLPALATFYLSGCTQLTDVTLTNLPALTSLDLRNCTQLTDVSPLSNLPALTTLDLSGCTQLTDISPLTNLPALTTLDLSGCTQLTDVSPLSNLPALTTLDLSGCTQLTDVTLTNLPALTTLYLSNCTQLTDISPLTNLPVLTTLDLSDCTKLTDISLLNDITRLSIFR